MARRFAQVAMRLLPPTMRPDRFTRRNRLVVYYLLALVGVISLYSVLYNVGMGYFENDHRPLFHSLQIVVETMTTTGYGADSPWDSAVMNLFVVFMQLAGIGIGFFTLRLIVIPLFSSAEVDLDSRLTPKSDHVVICEYRRDSAILLEELEDLGVEYVLISSDEEEARDLSNEGYSVIDGSPQERSAFERASIESARAVITDAGPANVDTILTVRSIRPDVEIIALTDDSDLREVLLDTGADSVLSPHGVLGHRLAEKAAASIDAAVRDAVELGEDVNVSEVPIAHDSGLVGRRIRDSRIREETGANVLGAWIDGELQLPPDPDAVIQPNTVLLVSGTDDALGRDERVHPSAPHLPRTRTHRRAGTRRGRACRPRGGEESGIDVVTVDSDEGANPDVVGDASSRPILEEAGVDDAGAIIVGLPDDSAALLASVLARSANPDAEILMRVNTDDDTRKALKAGADYVLSVPQISARMVAMELRGEAVIEPASQVRLVQVEASPFAESTLAESGIYEETGCRVVAIEDENGVSGAVDPHRELAADDRLTVAGTDDAIHEFLKQVDVARTDTDET
ncbi:potassium channel family protein [Halanaeroarchaeum sulfurireducens]|uniref:Potassium transporter TrkA n=1 Tax=Halanaeroarchaeum sulfurireducens TaxID=1604004 RepID=A0A0N9NAK5_9EURY|nr:NAD-binding protein [Halanaeroarchaeum sulfurireducens]ALG82416.1 potassium transporter TrkA [Halanaeroarchaeum sulfurireducens]